MTMRLDDILAACQPSVDVAFGVLKLQGWRRNLLKKQKAKFCRMLGRKPKRFGMAEWPLVEALAKHIHLAVVLQQMAQQGMPTPTPQQQETMMQRWLARYDNVSVVLQSNNGVPLPHGFMGVVVINPVRPRGQERSIDFVSPGGLKKCNNIEGLLDLMMEKPGADTVQNVQIWREFVTAENAARASKKRKAPEASTDVEEPQTPRANLVPAAQQQQLQQRQRRRQRQRQTARSAPAPAVIPAEAGVDGGRLAVLETLVAELQQELQQQRVQLAESAVRSTLLEARLAQLEAQQQTDDFMCMYD